MASPPFFSVSVSRLLLTASCVKVEADVRCDNVGRFYVSRCFCRASCKTVFPSRLTLLVDLSRIAESACCACNNTCWLAKRLRRRYCRPVTVTDLLYFAVRRYTWRFARAQAGPVAKQAGCYKRQEIVLRIFANHLYLRHAQPADVAKAHSASFRISSSLSTSLSAFQRSRRLTVFFRRLRHLRRVTVRFPSLPAFDSSVANVSIRSCWDELSPAERSFAYSAYPAGFVHPLLPGRSLARLPPGKCQRPTGQQDNKDANCNKTKCCNVYAFAT